MSLEPTELQPNRAGSLFGDNDTFASIYERYHQGVYFTAYRVCQNEADAHEVVSETFLKAYEHQDQFAGRSAISTWLYRIAYHVSLDLIKRKQREVTWEDKYDMVPDTVSAMDNLLDKMAKDQQLQYLSQAMLKLHPEDRVILGLRFDRGLSYEEIAEITGIPPNTVGTRIFRAKKLLLRLMKPGGEGQ
ncbi:MAG: RNA polymerase sigma factor [Methanomassiliicoccales archaeon]